MTPMFSILIPTVGRPQLLKQAIQSVLNQGVSDLEVVVADCDQSDDTKKVVAEFDDPRLRYERVPNRDPSLGWDFAFRCSTGRYVIWFDDDNCLLEDTLLRVRTLAEKYEAEIVSGSHAYYYPGRPDTSAEALGVLAYSGRLTQVEPQAVLRAFLNLDLRKRRALSFHAGSTFVQSELVRRVIDRVGWVVLPHLPVNHSVQPLVFGLARSCVHIDLPLTLVGRLPVSLSQQKMPTRAQLARKGYRYEMSPFSVHTYSNQVGESYMRAHRALGREDIPFNLEEFALRHARELLRSTPDLQTSIRGWIEILRFVASRSNELSAETVWRLMGLTILSFPAQLLKTARVWPSLLEVRDKLRSGSGGGSKTPRERRIALGPYQVEGILACAKDFSEVVFREFGVRLPPPDEQPPLRHWPRR